MKRQTIITLTTIVAVLVVAIFAGCVEKEAPVSTQPTNDDEAFSQFVIDGSHNVSAGIAEITNSLTKSDFTKMVEASETMETLVGEYLLVIDSYNVSNELLPSKKKWKEMLEELKLACTHYKIGAENEDVDELSKGVWHHENSGRIGEGKRPWHRVTTISGSGDKTTKAFQIKGTEWRVKYKTRSTSKYPGLSVFVYPKGTTVDFVSYFTCDEQRCDDEQYIYAGSGGYYFKVHAANLDSWELEVEDAY
jgi:PBP1b-binding outer membrane lipoprotein LpoB